MENSPAFDTLFAAAQQELSAMAKYLMSNERGNHTLQPTALVNEAYLRLFHVKDLTIESKAHFVNIAVRAMRQVLVDHARRKNSAKRGGGWKTVTLSGLSVKSFDRDVDVLELNEALEKLSEMDPRAAEVVELRIFGGLTMEEVACALHMTRRTAQKDWRFATMWLRREFSGTAGRPFE